MQIEDIRMNYLFSCLKKPAITNVVVDKTTGIIHSCIEFPLYSEEKSKKILKKVKLKLKNNLMKKLKICKT